MPYVCTFLYFKKMDAICAHLHFKKIHAICAHLYFKKAICQPCSQGYTSATGTGGRSTSKVPAQFVIAQSSICSPFCATTSDKTLLLFPPFHLCPILLTALCTSGRILTCWTHTQRSFSEQSALVSISERGCAYLTAVQATGQWGIA